MTKEKNNSTNKITFLLVTSINSKIEKNEKISAEISLQKNSSNENKNITCSSQYKADPVKNEEILMFYNCEVPVVDNVNEYNELIFQNSPYVKNIPTDSDKKNPKKTDELIKNGKIIDYSLIIFSPKSLDLADCKNTGRKGTVSHGGGNHRADRDPAEPGDGRLCIPLLPSGKDTSQGSAHDRTGDPRFHRTPLLYPGAACCWRIS